MISKKNEQDLNKKLLNLIKKSDLVIVSDYGHGFISKKSAEIICKNSKFLAINAQVNAANIGYHTLRNYNNFNTLIINEKEIRHEMRDKNTKLILLMKKLSKEKKIQNLIVLLEAAAQFLQFKKINFYADAYAKNIIDKIGAGDTCYL